MKFVEPECFDSLNFAYSRNHIQSRADLGDQVTLAREKMLDASFSSRAGAGAEPCAADRRRRRGPRGYSRLNLTECQIKS